MNKDLIKQYTLLHEHRGYYGSNEGLSSYHQSVLKFLTTNNVRSVLDFGCGKGKLVLWLQECGYDAVGYDPAIPKFSEFPNRTFDAVISLDVFEHLEEECLEDEFSLIRSVEPNNMYINIAVKEALHHLPDGRNCHTIVKDETWWRKRVEEGFSDFSIDSEVFLPKGMPSVTFELTKSHL